MRSTPSSCATTPARRSPSAHRDGILSDEEYEAIYNGVAAPDPSTTEKAVSAQVKQEEVMDLSKAHMIARINRKDSRELDRLRTLMALVPHLPRWAYRLIRKYSLWRLIPAFNLMSFVDVFGGDLWQKIRYGKTQIYQDVPPEVYLRQVARVGLQKIRFLWKQRNGRTRRPNLQGKPSVRSDPASDG